MMKIHCDWCDAVVEKASQLNSLNFYDHDGGGISESDHQPFGQSIFDEKICDKCKGFVETIRRDCCNGCPPDSERTK